MEIGSTQIYQRHRVYALYDGDARAADGRRVNWLHNLTFWSEAAARGFPVAKRQQVQHMCPAHPEMFETSMMNPAKVGSASSLEACLERKYGKCAQEVAPSRASSRRFRR